MSSLDVEMSPLTSVPAECKSLTVDERFAPFVSNYVGQPAKLPHLDIKLSSEAARTSGTDPLKALCELKSLDATQITEDEVFRCMQRYLTIHD